MSADTHAAISAGAAKRLQILGAHPARWATGGPLGTVVLLCLAAAIAPLSANADVFGPISLVSAGSIAGGPSQQAEYAHDSAISGDGRYVVFDGSVGGVTGVWRRDLATGALEQVAGGDAEMPSVSADGQYVSFTTNEGASLPEITHDQPALAPRAESVNVYVRDMASAPTQTAAEEEQRSPQERAFLVASAPSGSSQPLTYAVRSGESHSGSSAVGRSAISADGNEVAFVTTAVSNLVAYPQLELEELIAGKTPKPHTPPSQVAVRNLAGEETTLVSRCYFDCAEADAGAAEPIVTAQGGGAVYTGEVGFPNVAIDGEWPGASISADGSTVAWMGENIAEQAPTLSAEPLGPEYTEPLWRRIAPGSETVTRRVTGGSDPTNPQCIASGESVLPRDPSASDPCQGPFFVEGLSAKRTGIWPQTASGVGDFIPRLSADGEEVAFISDAKLLSEEGDFGRNSEGQESDLFVANMRPGYDRDEALTPLTELGPPGLSNSAPISEFEISSDGGQVAFTTPRTIFSLGQPAFVNAPAAEPGMPELFDADLRDGTLTRVTHGVDGEAEPSEQPHTVNPQEEDPYGGKIVGFGALSPSFSAGGRILAFTSTADNLVFGDGNTPPGESFTERDNGGDAFVVEPEEFQRVATPQVVSPAPTTSIAPAWTLGATALSRADGSVLLYVAAPGSGTLRATAGGTVLGRTTVHLRTRRGARFRRVRETLESRAVAAAAAVARAPGGELVTLTLKLRKPYAALASQRNGLSANVSLTFAAPREPSLHTTIAVSFRRIVGVARRSSKRVLRGVRRAHGDRR